NRLLVTLAEGIVPTVVPTEPPEEGRWQCQHPRVEDGARAAPEVQPERVHGSLAEGEQVGHHAHSEWAADRFAEILPEKPVRPMAMRSSLLVRGQEFSQGLAWLAAPAPRPPVFENRPLGEAIRPADDQDAAQQALAKEHAPGKFQRE